MSRKHYYAGVTGHANIIFAEKCPAYASGGSRADYAYSHKTQMLTRLLLMMMKVRTTYDDFHDCRLHYRHYFAGQRNL